MRDRLADIDQNCIADSGHDLMAAAVSVETTLDAYDKRRELFATSIVAKSTRCRG